MIIYTLVEKTPPKNRPKEISFFYKERGGFCYEINIIVICILMNNIKKILQEKRPNLATSSLRTYSSLLYNFVKKVFVDTDINDNNILTLLKKETEILKYLGKNEIPKTLLSALYVVTENPLYREMMMKQIESYNKEMLKQEKNEKQKENWADQDEIYKLLQKHNEWMGRALDMEMRVRTIVGLHIVVVVFGQIYPCA